MKWDRPIVIVLLLLSIVVLLYGVYLWEQVGQVNEGIDLGVLQKKVKELDTQNMVLQEQLLPLESLQNIASRAAEIGFIECRNCEFYVK